MKNSALITIITSNFYNNHPQFCVRISYTVPFQQKVTEKENIFKKLWSLRVNKKKKKPRK